MARTILRSQFKAVTEQLLTNFYDSYNSGYFLMGIVKTYEEINKKNRNEFDNLDPSEKKEILKLCRIVHPIVKVNKYSSKDNCSNVELIATDEQIKNLTFPKSVEKLEKYVVACYNLH